MKIFELVYLFIEPFFPVLYQLVRKRLIKIAKSYSYRPEILDVGGRKSHYTIGIPANITILDLTRTTEIQQKYNLGLNTQMIEEIYSRRSNVRMVILADMIRSSLPDASFDCVVAVEVLEHVEDDELFIKEVYRVLKPNKGVFLMTTPNRDYFNFNSEKRDKLKDYRFYNTDQLRLLLLSYFKQVEIECIVRGGKLHSLGCASWTLKHPIRTFLSMISNFINCIMSIRNSKNQIQKMKHIIAIAKKT